TTTRPGLRVVTELARTVYRSGIKASIEYLQDEPVIRDKQLPKYNYRFEPT
ncbi:MAG: ISAzo13 family transposase, partial [Planctomycetales bacterium]|nr:ISAzo13 family transposase [Planctomycetales bacterium]